MDVTELGMVVFWQPTINRSVLVSTMALQFSLLSYVGLFASTVMEVSPLHPEKAEFPMDVTELGIVIEVSPLHPEKAASPMNVTELGIVIEVSPLQKENAQSPMDVTELGMVMEVSSMHNVKT